MYDSWTEKYIQKFLFKEKQEWHFKRLNDLGGLEISIQQQIVNALELSPSPPKKINKNYEKHLILVISLVEKIGHTVKQSSDLKTSSIPHQCLEAQLSSLSLVAVLLILFVCHVHSGSHQYTWFSRISSTVASWYRKSTSLLKSSVSITSISLPIKLVNIAFQSVPCIHAKWAILGDDVHDASHRLLYFLLKTMTGPK